MKNDLVKLFIQFWKHEKFSSYVIPPTDSNANASDDRSLQQQAQELQQEETMLKKLTLQEIKDVRKSMNYIFSMLLTPGMVFLQQGQPKQSFEVLGKCITELINSGLVTVNFINEQCVKLLREEWEQVRFIFY